MPSDNDVLETKKKRLIVLNTIYDLAEQDELRYISTYNITNEIEILDIEISDIELQDILKFLKKQGLVKYRSPSIAFVGEGREAFISITHQGLCEVENVIKKPNEQTENFPE